MNKYLFKINAGFMLRAPVGESRTFPLEAEELQLDDDLVAKNIKCEVKLSRVQEGILVFVHSTAMITAECVRCLEQFEQPIDCEFDEMFAFRTRANNEAEVYFPDNGNIDLEEMLREYLILDIPISPICRPDCKGLCPICGNNLNNGTCNHPDTEE